MRNVSKIAVLSGTCLAWCLGASAFAQTAPEFSGVVQIHGAAARFSADAYTDERWHEIEETTEVGGFAAVAIAFTDRFSVQLDAWKAELSESHTDKDADVYSYKYDSRLPTSLAAHVSWRPKDDVMLGAMVSRFNISESRSPLYTFALEGAVEGERWRVSSQAGVLVTDTAADSILDQDVAYGWAQYAYYVQPNLSVAANVSAARDPSPF